jgi:hypothetical protein
VSVVWVLLGVAGLLLALWLVSTANRLDRMHHRIEVARGRLDAQLLRRSGVTLELAASDALDPASRLVLLDAAHRARSRQPADLEQEESALSQALRAVLGQVEDASSLHDDPEVRALVEELAHACVRVELSRRFHNDAVVSARALRSRRLVRWFRLAGRAAPLRSVDLDDVPPAGLADG